jgi:hypothetical protein
MESAAALETALAAQRAAIAREAKESDTLLLVDFMVKDSVNRVQQFSTSKVKDEGIAALSRSAPTTAGRLSAGPGAQIAHRIYAAQDSAHVTVVSVQGSSITKHAAGRSPGNRPSGSLDKRHPGLERHLPRH